MLHMSLALTESPGGIASTLVHEATHARLYRVDVPYTWESRERTEQLCRREEYRFVQRLDADMYPNHEEWLGTLQDLGARTRRCPKHGQGAHARGRSCATHMGGRLHGASPETDHAPGDGLVES